MRDSREKGKETWRHYRNFALTNYDLGCLLLLPTCVIIALDRRLVSFSHIPSSFSDDQSNCICSGIYRKKEVSERMKVTWMRFIAFCS